MSSSECPKCYQFDVCTHVREDITVIDPMSEYLYYVTYVGGYAVLTTNSRLAGWGTMSHETMVICVGSKPIGIVIDMPLKMNSRRILHTQFHSWEYAVDTHDFIVLGLQENMLVLSE